MMDALLSFILIFNKNGNPLSTLNSLSNIKIINAGFKFIFTIADADKIANYKWSNQ